MLVFHKICQLLTLSFYKLLGGCDCIGFFLNPKWSVSKETGALVYDSLEQNVFYYAKNFPEEIISAWVLQHTNANGKQWESDVAAGRLPSPRLRANQRRWSSVDLKEQGWQQATFEIRVLNQTRWCEIDRKWGAQRQVAITEEWVASRCREHMSGWNSTLWGITNLCYLCTILEFRLKLRFHLYSILKSTFFLHVIVNCSKPNSSINI